MSRSLSGIASIGPYPQLWHDVMPYSSDNINDPPLTNVDSFLMFITKFNESGTLGIYNQSDCICIFLHLFLVVMSISWCWYPWFMACSFPSLSLFIDVRLDILKSHSCQSFPLCFWVGYRHVYTMLSATHSMFLSTFTFSIHILYSYNSPNTCQISTYSHIKVPRTFDYPINRYTPKTQLFTSAWDTRIPFTRYPPQPSFLSLGPNIQRNRWIMLWIIQIWPWKSRLASKYFLVSAYPKQYRSKIWLIANASSITTVTVIIEG